MFTYQISERMIRTYLEECFENPRAALQVHQLQQDDEPAAGDAVALRRRPARLRHHVFHHLVRYVESVMQSSHKS